MSQKKDILKYLQSGEELTPIKALNLFNCFRLAARIEELRKEGYPIESQLSWNYTNKKVFANYWMCKNG